MLVKEIKQRDKLLFSSSIVPYSMGIARFQNATLSVVQELISLGFLSINEKQGKSPTTQEFINIAKSLIKSYPKLSKQISFQGYVMEKDRENGRTCLEGFRIERGPQDITNEMKLQLKLHFRQADVFEFESGEFWCWYD